MTTDILGLGFTHPEFFWLLTLLPVAVLALVGGYFARRGAEKAYGNDTQMYKYGAKPRRWLDNVLTGGWLVVVLGIVLTAAGPTSNNTPVRVPEGTVQAIPVVDVSKSTAAEDYREAMPADAGERPDINQPWGRRIDMAKYQIYKIMKAIEGNQLGLVTYTEEGFAQGELTTDFFALRFVLEKWVDVGSAPGNGSNFAKGLEEAIAMFDRKKVDGKQKVIILISDGGFTNDKGEEIRASGDERLTKALEEMRKRDIKLVIIGVGIPGKNAIPVYENGKLMGYMKDEKSGEQITTSFDADNLRDLATATGAKFHHIELDSASQTVPIDWANELGGSRIEMKQTELFLYFAGGTLGLATILVLLSLTRRWRSRN